MKKFWTALLAMAVLFGLLSAAAVADVMKNIKVTDVEFYPSGCLKGFTMSYDVALGLAEADIRVSVQTQQFNKKVSGYYYGDFTNLGKYAHDHSYPNWPDKPADCGFVSWAGGTFTRPAGGEPTTPLRIQFDDHVIDCGKDQAYYMYVWANYGVGTKNTYPDAYVTSFSTGNGKFTSSTGTTASAPSNTNQENSTQVAAASAAMPRTGDDSLLILWLAISLLAGAGVLVLLRRRASDR